MGYNIKSLVPLLSIGKEIGKDLVILYKGKKVEQVHLIEIDIINSGNVSIKSTDFYRPISVNFGDDAQIFTCEITKSKPSDLNPKIQINNNNLVLEPLLLNGGDIISLKILVEKFKEIVVEGRIIDINKISPISPLKAKYRRRVWISLVTGYVFMAVFYASIFFPEINYSNFGIPCFAIATLFIPIAIYFFIKSLK